jgi:FkbM family methyltransferase
MDIPESSVQIALLRLRVRKLFNALATRTGRRALLLRVAPAIEHHKLFQRFCFDLIVDVGANRGQFLLVAGQFCPAATIICYEPLLEPYSVLEKIAAQFDRVWCFPIALGEFNGQSSMFVTEDDDSSSLLRPTTSQIQLSSGSRTSANEIVTIARLDSRPELREALSCNSLLKIDVQGFELSVLKGAGSLLRSFSAIYVECSYIELYEGQALIGEVTKYLNKASFELTNVHNLTTLKGKAAQADFLFINKASLRNGAKNINV